MSELFIFLNNFSFSQVITLTITFSIIVFIFLYFLKRVMNSSNFKINMKTGEINNKSREEQESVLFKKFLKDVYLIVNKTMELNSRKEYLYLIERVTTQSNIASDYIKRKRAKMQKMFFDRLDKKLKEQGKNTDNITTHKDYLTYTILLDVLFYDTKSILEQVINEEGYIQADILSIDFKEYIQNKIEIIINNDNNILNQYYINVDTLTRTEVYKIYRENEDYFRNSLNDMFYDMKHTNDKYLKTVQGLDRYLRNYIETYISKGPEAAL